MLIRRTGGVGSASGAPVGAGGGARRLRPAGATIPPVLRILYVEDDATAREYIEKGLSEQGYQVTTAGDATSGLALALEAGLRPRDPRRDAPGLATASRS